MATDHRSKRGWRHVLQVIITGVTAVSVTGCTTIEENTLTGRLWTCRSFTEVRTVSTNYPIELYHAADVDDFLLAYREVFREGKRVETRSYFVRQNAGAIAEGRKPRFTSASRELMTPVPINPTLTNVPRASVDGGLLTITVDGGTETFVLASYRTSKSTAMQVGLTPLAMAGDASIAAAIVVFFAGIAWLESGAPCDFD